MKNKFLFTLAFIMFLVGVVGINITPNPSNQEQNPKNSKVFLASKVKKSKAKKVAVKKSKKKKTKKGYYIIISKTTNKLYLYKNGVLLRKYKVATGRRMSYTPVGTFRIVSKIRNPSWRNPKTGRIVAGGSSKNPLGKYWMGLSVGGGSKYGIHGNNNSKSIGTYASKGCIRMYNSEVVRLFNTVPINTPVRIGYYSYVPRP